MYDLDNMDSMEKRLIQKAYISYQWEFRIITTLEYEL